jgi:hypothetical protein
MRQWQGLQRQAAYQLGGSFTNQVTGQTESYAGMFGLEAQARGLSLGHQMRMFQLEGGTLGGGYGFLAVPYRVGPSPENGPAWQAAWQKSFASGITLTQTPIQQSAYAGVAVNLPALQQLGLDQLGSAGLSYRQFYERQDLARRQFELQSDWQGKDMERNYAHQRQMMDWQMMDLTRNWQRGNVQFGWAEESLAYQGAKSALGFGWQMEDLDESMRYATGRERRRLSRQRERATIEFGMGQDELTREEQHLKQKRQWADEDYTTEMDRLKIRRSWLVDEFEEGKKRHLEMRALQEEQWGMQAKHFEEDMALSKKRYEENVKYTQASAGLQAAMAAESQKQWKAAHDEEIEALKVQMAYVSKTREIEDSLKALGLMQTNQLNAYKEELAGAGDEALKTLVNLTNFIASAFSTSNTYLGDAKTPYKSFTEMVDAMARYVVNKAAPYQ